MQATLFKDAGLGATIGMSRQKKLETERQRWWDVYWYSRTKEIIKEIDEGKVFDNNEVDGLMRDFDIYSSDDWEELEGQGLSFEQITKKIMEKNILFFENEMGLKPTPEEIDFNNIDTNLNKIDAELEEIKKQKEGERHERKSNNLFKV